METKMNPMVNRHKTCAIDQEEKEKEDLVSLLESDVWNSALKTLFKQNLKDAKESLLNNAGLPTDTRVAYIMYRQKVIDPIKSLYRRNGVEAPSWLED